MISIVIIYRKFQCDSQTEENINPTSALDYSHSIYPLICISTIITSLLMLALGSIIKEILHNGVLVWHRDNLGMILSNLIFHIFLLRTLFQLQSYILSKEMRFWKADKNNDGNMDFFEAFRPMFIFISLYVFKITCIRTEYSVIKVVTCITLILLTIIGESHFDKNLENDAPIWMLAVPISIFLTCQAIHDLQFYYQTKSFKLRMFYCLDNPLKKIWVYGNLASTVVYCFCLLYWLCIIHYNENNVTGRREDRKALHLALGSVIFYLMFLLERVGTYLLDLFHS